MKIKCCSNVLDQQLWFEVIRDVGVSSRPLHRVKKQRAVLSLCSCEDGGERRQRALRQGTASPQVEGDNLLVQTQLAGDAVERLRVQIQDGDQ